MPDSVTSAVASSISGGLHFIGYLCGHTHQDDIWDALGDKTQLQYCITCAAVSYAPQWQTTDMYRSEDFDAFNLVTIDTTRTETYTGTPEKRLQYTYTGEPDGYYSGSKTYPLIDFEGDNDLSVFTSNTWSRSTEAAKDGKYGICSRTNYTQTSGKIYVNLNEPGILSFDMKVTNDEDGSLGVYINDDWEPVRSWNTEWESRMVSLRKGSYYVEFRYTKESASTKQVFIDNITIGKMYSTEITDLQDPNGTVNRYTYNPRHQLVKLWNHLCL